MIKKLKKSKDSQIVVSRHLFGQKFKNTFPSRRTYQFISDFERNRRMHRFIAING